MRLLDFGEAKALFAVRWAAGLASAAAIFCAGSASATQSDEITLRLRGKIPVTCEFSGGQLGVANFGTDLGSGESRSIGLSVNCNVPYEIVTRSANGALVTGARQTGPGIINQIPYDVSFSIPTTEGAATMNRCSSVELRDGNRRSCTRVSSGEGVTLDQKADVHITLASKPGEVPLAGIYADTIVMQIRPQV